MRNVSEINGLYGVHEVSIEGEHFWESENYDPQLSVKGAFAKGWYKFNCTGFSDELRYLKLYIDYGQGYSEENTSILGLLTKKENNNEKYLYFTNPVCSLRLDPGDMPGRFKLENVTISRVNRISIILEAFTKYNSVHGGTKTLTKIFRKWKDHGFKWLWNKAKTMILNHSTIDNSFSLENYIGYQYIEEIPSTEDFDYNPAISIVIAYNAISPKWLLESISSVVKQSYTNWEVVIVGSQTNLESIDLKSFEQCNEKIKLVSSVRQEFSDLIKDGLEHINGEFVLILEQEDYISTNTLSSAVKVINENQPDLIYFDEDRVSITGEHFAPFYKEKYSLNTIKNKKDIVGGLSIVRLKTLIHTIQPMAASSTIDDIMDEMLRKGITTYHIPKVYYHKKATEIAWDEKKHRNKSLRLIPFYLPQFHEIPENNEWWGQGFTEWTNVTKAKPLFKDHYQQHIPADLGYYNLVHDEGIKEKQADLARKYGIFGFCYYYYWFNGRRLLEKPLNDILENPQLDFPFCICWANESWSRRWDGQEKELLMPQVHNDESDKRFIEDIIPILKDSRYIRIDEAPVILIYRAELFPDLKSTVKQWRNKCAEVGINKIHVCMVQSFGLLDPNNYGCDSAVEFPPHGVYAREISDSIEGLVPEFNGNIYDYNEVVERSLLKEKVSEYSWLRSAMLSWDNTARRGASANIFNYASPETYEKWLIGLVDYTLRFNDESEQVIFINAWNEWAEGTHLEPDEKYGHRYLEATNRAINTR